MPEKPTISIVMPSFNEEEAIGPMIESIKKHTQDFETEIVVVDSSKDQTPDIARNMGAKVVTQEPKGHGIALRSAINEAKNDIIITTDCDNTYPMEDIPKLINLITNNGYDIISCNRLNKKLGKEMPFSNKLANKFFALLVRCLYGLKIHDVTTGMFCMKRAVNEKIKWETNYSFPCEIIIRSNIAGFKHKEIDIAYKLRLGEITLNKWRSGKAYLKCIFKYKLGLNIDSSQL